MFVNCVSLGEGGRNYPKKKRKKPKRPLPNLKFAVAFGFFFRFFSAFFGIFRFFVVLFRFFRSELRQKISVKNRVNNEVLGGQELPIITHSMHIKPCKCLMKAILTNKNHLTRTR